MKNQINRSKSKKKLNANEQVLKTKEIDNFNKIKTNHKIEKKTNRGKDMLSPKTIDYSKS